MKTKWGSCNIAAKRIWLNLELAKKPPECLAYILVRHVTQDKTTIPKIHGLLETYGTKAV